MKLNKRKIHWIIREKKKGVTPTKGQGDEGAGVGI
jgi:hypothetical protein